MCLESIGLTKIEKDVRTESQCSTIEASRGWCIEFAYYMSDRRISKLLADRLFNRVASPKNGDGGGWTGELEEERAKNRWQERWIGDMGRVREQVLVVRKYFKFRIQPLNK